MILVGDTCLPTPTGVYIDPWGWAGRGVFSRGLPPPASRGDCRTQQGGARNLVQQSTPPMEVLVCVGFCCAGAVEGGGVEGGTE